MHPALGRRLVAVAWLVSMGLADGGPVLATPLERTQDRTQRVTVTVLGRNDAPVTTLTAADLIVREDKAPREIIAMTPALAAGHIALLVDDSQATMQLVTDVREGLTKFADMMAAADTPPSLRLTTFGDRPTVRVDFTSSFSAISRGIDRIVPQAGAGATLLEAIVETCRDMRTRKIEQPIILAFVAEAGAEFSNASREEVTDALRSAGARLWTIVLTDRQGPPMSGPGHERSLVVGDVTVASGGFTKNVLNRQAIVPAFTAVATAMASSYEITFGRPDRLVPPSRLEIEARDRALKVVAPRWARP